MKIEPGASPAKSRQLPFAARDSTSDLLYRRLQVAFKRLFCTGSDAVDRQEEIKGVSDGNDYLMPLLDSLFGLEYPFDVNAHPFRWGKVCQE